MAQVFDIAHVGGRVFTAYASRQIAQRQATRRGDTRIGDRCIRFAGGYDVIAADRTVPDGARVVSTYTVNGWQVRPSEAEREAVAQRVMQSPRKGRYGLITRLSWGWPVSEVKWLRERVREFDR